MSLPEFDPAIELLRRSPLERDNPHIVCLARVCHGRLHLVVAVKILALGEVGGILKVGDIPGANVSLIPRLCSQQESLEGVPAPDGDPEVCVGGDPLLVHDQLHGRHSGLGREAVSRDHVILAR